MRLKTMIFYGRNVYMKIIKKQIVYIREKN